MISILLNLLLALGVSIGLTLADISPWGWSIVWFVLIFVAGQIAIGRFLRWKMNAVTEEIQSIMARGQAKMQAKVQRWRTKQMSNQKAAEAELAKDRDAMIAEIQALLKPLERYRLWIPLLGRQLATMEMQFAWQKKDWKRVDLLLNRALFVEPMIVCMKLARMWQQEATTEELQKVFKKAVRRARYGTTVLLYSTMAWMLVKRGQIDEAFKVLTEADEKNESPVLKANRENLANNRLNHFSNAGLGEEWYTLFLEEPKMRAQRQRSPGRFFA